MFKFKNLNTLSTLRAQTNAHGSPENVFAANDISPS